MISDTFKAFGAEPVTTPANEIYAALKSGKVEAQENPLAILEGFRLYDLVKYVSLTNHMWSGFNLMSHLPTWQRLPADIQATIERSAANYVRQQRADQAALNAALRTDFVTRGLVFNDTDQAAFRARLPAVYGKWKGLLGAKCWALIEDAAGPLG
jgi:TRAP-type C4-dicarboxylate transport system substrate-binding protein